MSNSVSLAERIITGTRRVAGAALDPAACCGHSLGWYAALVAAGVIDEAASLDLIAHVFLAGHAAFAQDDGEVAIVTLREPADFARVAAATGVEILCANNAVQHVLHGSPEQLAAVERELGAALLGLMKLPTHIPFHSRRLDVLRPQLDGLAARLGIRPAPMRRQLWSHIDARPVANGAAALALVETQPWQQVRWLDMVERLIQAGGYELVEVGPNRVLTQLTRWICPQLDIEFTDHLRRKERA